MAPPNFLAGSAFVKLYWNLGNALAINVLGMRVTGSPGFDQAFAEVVGTAVKSAFTANLATHISTAAALVRVGVRDYRTANRPEFRDTGAQVAGSGATAPDMIPPNAALCITLRTALTGKSQRGRVYLGGFAEADNSGSGQTVTAAATASIAFLNAIKTALTAQGLVLSVISRPAELKVLTLTTTHNDGTTSVRTLSRETAKAGGINEVTAFESRTAAWESQRRRANGRGTVPTVLEGRFLDVS